MTAAQSRGTGSAPLMARIASLLTARRVLTHATLLAVCMWSLYALDLATPGLRDRAGHIKGADFVHFYTAGRLLQAGRLHDLYDPAALAAYQQHLIPESRGDYFVASYGPQVYLPFSLLARLPYGWAAWAWALLNCALYLACCYAVWRCCPRLQPYAAIVFVLALAFPGFFTLIAFGQSSGPALLLLTLAFLCLRSRRMFMAGLALGSLVYKPQLGMAAAVVFLLAAEWKLIAGAVLAAAAQLSFAWAWFGAAVMRQYFQSLLRTGHMMAWIEPRLYQLHSLRGFWSLLVPWGKFATALYLISAGAVLILAAVCWHARGALSLRYAALLMATVLVAPHLIIYDLVILAPAWLLLSDWVLEHREAVAGPGLRVFLYAAYPLPLLETLTKFSHVQLSVVGFVALQWWVWRALRDDEAGGRQLAQVAGA